MTAVDMCGVNNIFLKNLYFVMLVSIKNLILYAKRKVSGLWKKVSYLTQGNKMNECCLKNGQGSKALAANLRVPKLWYPWVWCPPPGFQLFLLHHLVTLPFTTCQQNCQFKAYHQATQIPVKQLTFRICTMRLSLEHKTSICLSSIPYQKNIES